MGAVGDEEASGIESAQAKMAMRTVSRAWC